MSDYWEEWGTANEMSFTLSILDTTEEMSSTRKNKKASGRPRSAHVRRNCLGYRRAATMENIMEVSQRTKSGTTT